MVCLSCCIQQCSFGVAQLEATIVHFCNMLTPAVYASLQPITFSFDTVYRCLHCCSKQCSRDAWCCSCAACCKQAVMLVCTAHTNSCAGVSDSVTACAAIALFPPADELQADLCILHTVAPLIIHNP